MRLLVAADALPERHSSGEADEETGGNMHLPVNEEKQIDALKARLRQRIRRIRRTLERRDSRMPQPEPASK